MLATIKKKLIQRMVFEGKDENPHLLRSRCPGFQRFKKRQLVLTDLDPEPEPKSDIKNKTPPSKAQLPSI